MNRSFWIHLVCSFCLIALLCDTAQAASLPFGAKKLANGDLQINDITVRTKARELAFPVQFVLQQGALEVILATPQGRLHEALLSTTTKAVQVQSLLYLLNAKNGYRLPQKDKKQGDIIDIFLEWETKDGKIHREPVENWILDLRTKKPLRPIGWVFVGSSVKNGKFMADQEGNLILNYSVGETILDSPDPNSMDDTIHAVNSEKKQPSAKNNLKIIMAPREK